MKPAVYVGGTFDLFHPGHVNLLRSAAALGPVTVAVNTDDFAERYKRRPIMSLEERIAVVGACRYVSDVIVNTGGEDSKPAILEVKPRYLVHGSDWAGERLYQQMGISEEFLREQAIIPVHPRYTAGVSTRELIERCRASGS